MVREPWVAALFVPADRPERYAKALSAGADIVIIDLEDAVAPARKSDALQMLAGADLDWRKVAVRINAPHTPWHAAEMAALRDLPLAALMVPKAEMPSMAIVSAMGIPLVPLIETARGLAQALVLAQAPGVIALAFGSIDYCHDLGCEHDPLSLLFPRSELVLASRLAGLSAPLDGVTARFDDPLLVQDDARRARALGFGGKLLIHPQQLAPTRAAFAVSAEDLAWARAVLAIGPEGGATAAGGEMIDRPVRQRAEALLARAARTGDA